MRSSTNPKPGSLAVLTLLLGCLAAPFVGAQVIASQMTNLMAPTCSASYTSYSTPINEATAGHFFFPSSVKQVDIYFGKAWGNVLSGCRTSMRFALSSVDFDLFLRMNARIKLPLTSTANWKKTIEMPESWNFEGTVSFLVGSSLEALDYSQWVFVDTTDPKQYIIYTITDYHD